jgi:uncharacterized membrane protein required for colicin V production
LCRTEVGEALNNVMQNEHFEEAVSVLVILFILAIALFVIRVIKKSLKKQRRKKK